MVEYKEHHSGNDVSLDKRVDILHATFKHYFDMALDHHTKAGTTSHILLIIVTALIALAGQEQTGELAGLTIGCTIFFIGLFGMVWVRKQHERYFYWQHIAYRYQRELAKIVPNFKTGTDYYADAREVTKADGYGVINQIRDRHFWVTLHFFIAFSGLLLVVRALYVLCVRSNGG
jgi:hypothetical protein